MHYPVACWKRNPFCLLPHNLICDNRNAKEHLDCKAPLKNSSWCHYIQEILLGLQGLGISTTHLPGQHFRMAGPDFQELEAENLFKVP